MTADLSARDVERASLITRRVSFRDYLWFAAALLVLIATTALQTQAP